MNRTFCTRKMVARFWVIVDFCCVLLILGGDTSAAMAQTPAGGDRPPNVIVILVDDLGYSDLGSYGSEIDTPNLDQLASQGIRFRQFYNTAKCNTTRGSIMTGNYWQNVGLRISRGITTGFAMRDAGYYTFAVGKWHLGGNPVNRGFDKYFGHLSGATNYFKGDESFRLNDKEIRFPDYGQYTTDAFTDYALKFIDQAKREDASKPFYLYLAYNAPHTPLQVPRDEIKKYEDRYTQGWEHLRQQRYRRQLDMGLTESDWPLPERPDEVPAWGSISTKARKMEAKRMATYAAMIDRLDQNIGRLVQGLDQRNLKQNTLVMFLSDNGASPFDRRRRGQIGTADSFWSYTVPWAWASNTPFRFYKRNQHNGGITTPFIAYWPAGIPEHKQGAIVDRPGHVIDIPATLYDLADWQYPGSFGEQFQGRPVPAIDGKSLVPIFKGEKRQGHEALYFQFRNHRAIIKDGYKLVSDYDRSWKLHNLATDRSEIHDLSRQKPEIRQKLADDWQNWWDDVWKRRWNVARIEPPRYPSYDKFPPIGWGQPRKRFPDL